jgi:predicted DNA repair protein MutK
MAGASLLTLLDDIAAVLDDVALMTKVAAKKTAGVLGDDLALNAQQVTGVRAERELPVVWAVAKGSFRNKLILVPAALLISAFAPWAVTPLLMFGGAFLCYEGFEKLAHKFLHSKDDTQAQHEERLHAVADPEVDMLAFEQDKVKGAIRTDFILSAEIIAITLGTVALASFGKQVAVLSGIAILMTVGVYGLVAGIVKLDDAGLYLNQRRGESLGARLQRSVGRGLLLTAPYLMKSLSILGTAAMFMVGGGILTHGVHAVQLWIEQLAHSVAANSGLLAALLPTLLNAVAGIIAGAIALLLVSLASRLWKALKADKTPA